MKIGKMMSGKMKKGGLRKDKRDQLLCVNQSQHFDVKKLLSFSTARQTYFYIFLSNCL